MSKPTKITYEAVAEAANAIALEGGKPSVRLVMARIGGSPNTVLPMLREWQSGRPVVRAADIAVNPEIFRLLAEQISTSNAQSAQAAEERAAEAEAEVELLAEAGRAAEANVEQLEQVLEQTQFEVASKVRALEDLALERSRDQQTALETIGNLKVQIDGERERADVAVRKVAEDKVRLEALPKLEAEVQRLAVFEQNSAVLTAKLEDAQAVIEELRQRLATAEKATSEARAATEKASREAEQARIGEQSAQAKLESSQRETEVFRVQALEAKSEVKDAREELKGLRAQLLDKPKAEAKPPKA
ncbi:hypothetical protein D3C85_701970 [compost metagenome]